MPWELKEISFENYRTFAAEERVSLRAMTVLIGRNSSGKSAVVRLPLLLRRAFSPSAQAPLEVEFDGYDFGASFLDLVHSRIATRGVTLGAVVSDGTRSLSVKATVNYWQEYGLQAVTAYRLAEGERSLVDLRWDRRSEPTGDGLRYVDAEGAPLAVNFVGLNVRSDNLGSQNLKDAILSWEQAIREALLRTVYLGPFRDAPAREMRIPEAAVRDVGQSGGSAGRVLAHDMLRNGSAIVRRVGDWYRDHLGGWTLDLVREGQQFSVVLHPPGEPDVFVNLRDAGVGLSQVLPVIVQHELDRASGRSGGLDIVEQPELHLHPGAHGDLADLYVDAVQRGNARFLIETHSENFVLRLRRRVAEGVLRADQIAIYWVDDDVAAAPRVRPIGLNAQGGVTFWPEGVFAEDFEEAKAIRSAQASRRA